MKKYAYEETKTLIFKKKRNKNVVIRHEFNSSEKGWSMNFVYV